jgi:hypothetical protein
MDYLEKAKTMAAELPESASAAPAGEIEVALAIDAGVIPESPAAAYRLGIEHGRKGALADPTSGNCWACGKPAAMPDHAAQVRDLAAMHYRCSGPWHWAPSEFEALRQILEAEGEGAFLDAIISRRPFYGTVRVVKANRLVIDVPRRTLVERAKQLKP